MTKLTAAEMEWQDLNGLSRDERAEGPTAADPQDCEVCGGDCSSANPPMNYCPIRDGRTAAPETKGEVIVEQGDRVNQNMIAPTNVNLWSDEIERLLEAGFATVSRNPSDHETCVAYRTAIWLAMTATRPASTSGTASSHDQ